MKQAFAVVWQGVILYLAALVGFATGVAAPGLRVSRELSRTTTNLRTYDFDWLIAIALMYVLLLVVGTARKRLPSTALTATIALVLVVATVAIFTQLGIKNTAL